MVVVLDIVMVMKYLYEIIILIITIVMVIGIVRLVVMTRIFISPCQRQGEKEHHMQYIFSNLFFPNEDFVQNSWLTRHFSTLAFIKAEVQIFLIFCWN